METLREIMEKQQQILKRVFGYDSFRPLQEQVIGNILAKKDTLVIMPTGGGKSLCYQIPALIFNGLTIVISPLISLMKDQVEQLAELGVPAVVLNSSLSQEEYRRNMGQVAGGRAKLLYLAPETLLKETTRNLLSRVSVDCITIDEAHCISSWGHDFRPEYRQIAEMRIQFPGAVCVALTATATPRVREDIAETLKLDSGNSFISSFNRENLFLRVVRKDKPQAQTRAFLESRRDQSGIIYCFSRKQVEQVAEKLSRDGFSVKPYHAGLPEQQRARNQEMFIRDDVQIIVATIAFGMGINKPNVRFVIHYDLPKNIEGYYQEIGRAGRDGIESHCLLLLGYGDIQKLKHFFEEKSEHEQRVAGIHLGAMLNYAETEVCRRKPLLNYFGETYSMENCGMCDNCTEVRKERVDITIPAQKFLSCVKRTGEMFGAGHIADVLRGSSSKKIFKFGHEKLSTYGIGKDFSRKQWMDLARQFLHQDLMVQDMEYGSLKLTEKAWKVFRKEELVYGLIHEEGGGETSGSVKGRRSSDAALSGYDTGLFKILMAERKKIADDARVPPYVIFSEKTMVEMAYYIPLSRESLLTINGVGEVKLKKYGDRFLGLIRDYSREHGNSEISKSSAGKGFSQERDSGKKKRHVEVGELFNKGRSVEQIAQDFHVKNSTVLKNLFKYVQEGNRIEADGIIEMSGVHETIREKVFEVFETRGYEYLKPAQEALKNAVSYEELEILRLYHISRNFFPG